MFSPSNLKDGCFNNMLGDIQLTKRLVVIALVLGIIYILKEYVFVYPL